MMIELIDRVEGENILGEGVIWNSRTQTVWWTDIEGFRLYCYEPQSKELICYSTPERLCSFAFTSENDWLIVAFESGFAHFNPKKEIVRWIAKPQQSQPHIRFNDGRVDRQGRFWAGTMMEEQGDGFETGCLYRLDKNGEAIAELEDISIANSLCWSPDSKKAYFADSPLNRIDIYDFDAASGSLSNRKTFATTPDHIYPDGSIVDKDGYLWNAQWGGSRVVRYAPDGNIDHILELPVSQPTCVAFGGADMDMLFVTTADKGLSEERLDKEPLAGDLLIYKTDQQGIAEQYVEF